MARTDIHELADWPRFTWDCGAIAPLLSEVRLRQGLLLGRMKSYGFASQWAATLILRGIAQGFAEDPLFRSKFRAETGYGASFSHWVKAQTSL